MTVGLNNPSAKELLARLNDQADRPDISAGLVLISLGMLPVDDAPDALWWDLGKFLLGIKSRYGVQLYDLSLPDRAALAKVTEFNQISLVSDIKMGLLRLVQEYYPEHFGMIDQSRLIRLLMLRSKMPVAVRHLEQFLEQEKKPVTHWRRRKLHEDDILRVEEVFRALGPTDFAKAFVRRQCVAVIDPGGPPRVGPAELFISMDALRNHVFPDVELRGSGNRFNQLTVTLDRLLLDAFEAANPLGRPCSVNLNVETVFTRDFEAFVKETRQGILDGITFEFRQANVLQHYDEYALASRLIRSKGGTIAIDSIFPETVGVVNVTRLDAAVAKVFWRHGAEEVLPGYADDIRFMLDKDVRVVLARVDEPAAVTLAHDLGITWFQGFLVDDLLKKKEAAA